MPTSLVDRVESAIANSTARITKLPTSVFEIHGCSGRALQILLNEMCSFEPTRYLEVGVRWGKTYCAAVYDNHLEAAYGVDYWQPSGSKEGTYGDQTIRDEFLANVNMIGGTVNLVEGDCWTIDRSQFRDINVYLYDAGHSWDDHIQAMILYRECLSSQAIVAVDDWFTKVTGPSGKTVKEATMVGIEQAGYRIVQQWELGTGANSDPFGYWNGLGLFVLDTRA